MNDKTLELNLGQDVESMSIFEVIVLIMDTPPNRWPELQQRFPGTDFSAIQQAGQYIKDFHYYLSYLRERGYTEYDDIPHVMHQRALGLS